VKRSLGILAGLGILSLAGYLGGRSLAQAPIQPVSATQPAQPATAGGQPPTAMRTRIAVVNIAEVLRNYKKAKAVLEQITIQAKTIDGNELQPIRADMIRMRTEMQNQGADPAVRERLERDMRKRQLELQEKEEDARKRITKIKGEYMVQLFREIEEAVKYYARISDLDLVFFYSDLTDPANAYDPYTVQAKLNTGGALPMYVNPSMDITTTVWKSMNDWLDKAAAAQPRTGN
jgi:Skp family chaperone for outer membrane proteins